MPEKEIKFSEAEIAKKQEEALTMDKEAEETEQESEQLFLWDSLRGLLEARQISEEEIKEYAEKFMDLKNPQGVLIHISESENLENILKKGILSHKFSERASMPDLTDGFDPVQQLKYGIDNISFYDSDVFALVSREWGLPEDETLLKFIFVEWLVNSKTKIGIVIKKSELPAAKKQSREIDDWPGEVLIKPRIAPRFFSGLIIGSECKIDPNRQEGIVEHIRKNKILIYNTSGDLIWPKISLEKIEGRTN